MLVEAMSCGMPVVAFDCPYGPAGIVSEGHDGFLVPPGDLTAFAGRLCLLMDNEELRHTMGRQAVVSAQRYMDAKIMPLWEQLFKEMGLPV